MAQRIESRVLALRWAHDVFALLELGASLEEIAGVLGLELEHVRQIVVTHETRARRELGERVDHHRAVQLSRLEDMLTAIWPQACGLPDEHTPDRCKPSLQAVNAVLKIMKRQANLLGLDAPKRLDVDARVAHGLDLAHLSNTDLDTLERTLTQALAQAPVDVGPVVDVTPPAPAGAPRHVLELVEPVP